MRIENWRDFVKDNLAGLGLEIGAYFAPFPYNKETTSMTYQDYLSTEKLKELGATDPNVTVETIVDVDVVSDASVLPYEDETFDFICNSHVLEHLANPLKAIEVWMSKIKTGGHLYLVVPDYRYTFDSKRDLTELKHLVDDYRHPSSRIEFEHYFDYCKNVENSENYNDYYETQSNIHVHTFEYVNFVTLLENFRYVFNYEIVDHKLEGMHICVLLRKI